ncbi:general transcription factor IIE subunit 2-like [Varroa jacobsoni]|uniref:Transcription initiation factor IIE subunit beta n=1 Tax=Varroa destructor TaxID=109461 RepID=A0A7M7KPJ5_VARDE|nr:general transcription factor IIE subunit 2-like [Varroa destructor]XP_022704008.1 general transcription factor IIE subunit 2-like [Varroa jacobsoni]
MDSALLKEREAFKKRAMAVPVVENRSNKRESPPRDKKKPLVPSKVLKPPSAPKDPFRYKTIAGGGANSFSVLAKIVKYMRTRHLEGDTHPLTLEEILDETSQMDIGVRHKQWLQQEALISNPKIDVTDDGKYAFKPPYNVKDRKSLLRLLERHMQRGLGGIYLEDIRESMANADDVLKKLGDNILYITRPTDKKVVLFFNDKSVLVPIDEDLIKLWHSVSVDSVDDAKIEEYLKRQGIQSMQDHGLKKVDPAVKRKKGAQKKARKYRRHNEHLSDVLMEFTET